VVDVDPNSFQALAGKDGSAIVSGSHENPGKDGLAFVSGSHGNPEVILLASKIWRLGVDTDGNIKIINLEGGLRERPLECSEATDPALELGPKGWVGREPNANAVINVLLLARQ
jgi:hypothetical protein